MLVDRTLKAAQDRGVRQVIAGRGRGRQPARSAAEMRAALEPRGIALGYPPPALCTDNAAMIAAAGYYLWRAGVRHDLDLNAIPGLGLGIGG